LPQSTLGRKTETSGEIGSDSFVTTTQFKVYNAQIPLYKFYDYFDIPATVVISPSDISVKIF
jgi:hypothetical protein